MDINIEALTVTYKNSFCTYLTDNFIESLYIKYNLLIKKLLQLDEFVFLSTSRRLFKSSTTRFIYRRYIKVIEKCHDGKDFNSCSDFCSEFNINRLTFIFDGEISSFTSFDDEFNTFFEDYEKDE